MNKDCRHTLLFAFERALLPPPQPGERWLVLNGQCLPENPFGLADAHFVQGFRPEFLALVDKQCDVVPVLEDDRTHDHSIVLAARVKAVNEANFELAWERTKTDGLVVVCGDKTNGIGSLRKRVQRHVSIIDSVSKHHGVCFWCRKTDAGLYLADRTKSQPAKTLFSSGKPDAGSQVLAAQFGNRIGGKVADFGSGWGYLSQCLLEHSPAITSLDLYEAEWDALEHSRQLLAKDPRLGFHWCDLTREFRKSPFDWVIMNPPMHHGLHASRENAPGLGQNFIKIAASTLVQGGRLMMVANRNLPYEKTLNSVFRKVTVLTEESSYKVIEAVR